MTNIVHAPARVWDCPPVKPLPTPAPKESSRPVPCTDEVCDRCYKPAADGEHGIGLCPFEKRRDVIARSGFEPRFDYGLGEYVSGWGDVRQHMRRNGLDFVDYKKADTDRRFDRASDERRRQREEARQ